MSRKKTPIVYKTSVLERYFMDLWEQMFPDIKLDREIKLIPGRNFRFDFVHEPSKLAIEINGGIYGRGRHSRGKAQESDYDKILLAARQGYVTVQLGTTQITMTYLNIIKEIINVRLEQLCE